MEEVLKAEDFIMFMEDKGDDMENIYHAMREFAKAHVASALNAAAENAITTEDYGSGGEFVEVVDISSILESYPLDNIK